MRCAALSARRAVIGTLAASALLGMSAAQASNVNVFVLAPQPPSTLETVEKHGTDKPKYAHSYAIPYSSLEKQIQKAIDSQADIDLTGTEKCPSACPDVHWRVKVDTSFNFTQHGQPVIKTFGDPQANGVEVSLQTQFHLRFDIHTRAWIKPVTGEVGKEVPLVVDLVIGLKANSKLNLWPTVISQVVPCTVTQAPVTACVLLTLDGKNYDLSGLNGAAIELGAELGAIIGASPLGAGIGGELGALVGALGGEAAAEAAKARIQSEADKALNAAMQVASQMATQLGSQYLDAKVTQANALKDFVMKTKLPGINKSYEELANAFGVSFDVQTVKYGSDLNVYVTPRFAAVAGNGKIQGKLRLPKEACVYMKTGWGYVPMGFQTVNADLAAKAGSSCSAVLGASSIKPSGYLGANPASASIGAKPLQTWKPVGSGTLTGNLSVYSHGEAPPSQDGGLPSHTTTGYYECGFAATGLPNADFVELGITGEAGKRLGYDRTPRYLEVTAAGLQAVLDNDWNPVTGNVIIGGEGQCTSGSVQAPHYEARSWLDRVQDLFDPDKCPNCDVREIDDRLQITNPDPLMQIPALAALIGALERGEPLPATGAHVAPQAPGSYMAPQTTWGTQQQAPVPQQQWQQPQWQQQQQWQQQPQWQHPQGQQPQGQAQPQWQQPTAPQATTPHAVTPQAPLLQPRAQQPIAPRTQTAPQALDSQSGAQQQPSTVRPQLQPRIQKKVETPK